MAVIVQKLVGAPHGGRFYPNFAGVAKSHNFYPAPPQESKDGIVSVALGLGKTVVDGGLCVRFCPKYPLHLQQLSSTEDTLANNQHEFFALDLGKEFESSVGTHDTVTTPYRLEVAETDGTLGFVGSTYSAENDAVYDGISRSGMRLVTFSPVLKNKLLPLPEILTMLLDEGSSGMGSPVEIEFAVTLDDPAHRGTRFGVLQMRPLVVSREFEELRIETTDGQNDLRKFSRAGERRHRRRPGDIVTDRSEQIQPREEPGMRLTNRPIERPARLGEQTVPSHRRRALGDSRSVAWHTGSLGSDFRRARNRRGRVQGLHRDALAGFPLLSKPHRLHDRLLHDRFGAL
jgi:hypothetical protein